MKTIQNNTPKPDKWIWKIILSMTEANSFADLVEKLTGIHLKHGEVRFTIKNYIPVKVSILHTTVVDVVDEPISSSDDTPKTANKAVDNKD